MTSALHHIALMQAQTFPAHSEVPDWIHLIPAGSAILTQDGRGPYRVLDAQSVVSSLVPGDKLPVDENHAIDLAGPRGEPSPARGYIVELQARDDGIWGRVEWTDSGRALMADRAYLGISPVIVHDGANAILGVARASLTNKPNLRGLTSLHHQETDMTLPAVAKALGLSDDAGEDKILAAIGDLKTGSAVKVALQSSLSQIGQALGIAADATPEQVLAAAQSGIETHKTINALQSELAGVTTQLNTLRDKTARDMATAFVDGAIKEGRVGVKPLRDHYIAMHMQDPGRVEKEIGAMPSLGMPAHGDGPQISLQSSTEDLVGRARTYQAARHAEGIPVSWADAVTAVSEGKK